MTEIAADESMLPALDSLQSEIRILEVEAGIQGSPIQCKFHVISLDNPEIPYEALSYTWGTNVASLQPTVYVRGKEFDVTESLYGALQRLRLGQQSRYLWIDAFCINQADNKEKTQVSMMCRIYSQCTQCLIWLGPLEEIAYRDGQAAIDFLSWLAGSQKRPRWFDDDSAVDGAAMALKAFINGSWWGRIWTVQEAILPHQAIVFWGPYEISWDSMRKAANSFFGSSAPKVPGVFWQNRSLVDLQSVMRGLAITLREPLCNYSFDVREVYERTTIGLIDTSGDLIPLIGRGGEGSDIPGLASWAVDWNGVQDHSRRSTSNFWDHRRIWHDLGYTADRGLFGVSDGLRVEDERVLRLQGLRVDRICVVENKSDGVTDLDDGSLGSLFLSAGSRWGRLITTFQQLAPDQLPSNWMGAFLGLITGKLIPRKPDHGDDIKVWARQIVRPQALFITDSGLFGLGPRHIQPGQELWIIGGSRLPVVLSLHPDREGNKSGTDFAFVGECFLHGIMTGEAVENRPGQAKDIRLH
ncbi:heterokaryon incompatibility protein [Fusarium subglutinans]|uniref:Heterokaryon incompatibility protein n=1 Tax=Gibberella subglutinans TaxID=42677 RepID=A0A8H5P6L1_GIBSU|nr:heterokaryon incompatibility protein [Fusarium subglutinans]KAF5590845.1 heterokaryon incompatibility protein [Fusarium subglutinans]